jgi:hypothetical protein
MGLPFTTRLANKKGLFCPKDLANQIQYICEACTVRSVLKGELGVTSQATVLLMLERARMVDTANKWSTGTLKAYQSKYNVLGDFERDLGVTVLPLTRPTHPPDGPAVRLMWAQERYSLYPAEWRKRHSLLEETIKFGTVRGLRSAASHFWTLDLLQNQSEKFTFGFKNRPLIVEACSPTDQAAFTYFTEGMRRRLGDHPRPSAVLTGKHMKWITHYYDRLYLSSTMRVERRQAACAAVTHLASYIGWLRAIETFTLRWKDLRLVEPQEGPTVGLPPGVGIICAKLLEQTKSMQFDVADVVMAYTTASGLKFGEWIHRLKANSTPAQYDGDALLISSESGATWTSHHYRHRFLYPALAACRASGDPFLKTIDDTPGNTIPLRFWSFNTQRRTGRSEVSKKRPWTLRAATPAEVVEHGRWRLSRSSLDMPLAYLEWSIEDRACVTIVCM